MINGRWKKSPREWAVLVEAGVLLFIARIALKVLPPARIVSWIRRPLGGMQTGGMGELRQVQWAVTAFSRNAPLRLVCFPQALAMHAMLRRRSVPSEVLYGAARMNGGKLATHAWLRVDGHIWLGGAVASDFTVLDVWKPAEVAAKDEG